MFIEMRLSQFTPRDELVVILSSYVLHNALGAANVAQYSNSIMLKFKHAQKACSQMRHSFKNLHSSCSVSGCIGPDFHDWSVEKDCSQRWLLWTLPRHPAKLHESHSCRQHQLRGLRVHEDWPRNFQMMLRVRKKCLLEKKT